MIVSGLSVLLFFFISSYGVAVKEKVGIQYRSEYATSALKTMLYSSTPRVAGETLENTEEVDFLLAAIKEDFADDADLNHSKELIVNNVVGLMEPQADSFDYFYYIYLPESQEFVFFLLYASKFSNASGSRFDVGVSENAVYLCKPDSLDDLDGLLSSVGTLYQANSRMQLPKLLQSGGRGYEVLPAQVNLTMWVSTQLPETTSGTIWDSSHLNCECHKQLELKNPGCDPASGTCQSEWKPC